MTYRFKRDTKCWGGQLIRAGSLCESRMVSVGGFGLHVVILDGKARGALITTTPDALRALSPLEQLAMAATAGKQISRVIG